MSESNEIISLNDSFSSPTSNLSMPEDETSERFCFRCSECWRIPRIFCNFFDNNYNTICDKQHKNEYQTFDSLLENTYKNVENLLCQICKKSEKDLSKMFGCNDCNLFFCSKCKEKHTEETNHSNFLDLNKFDINCEKHYEQFKYFSKDIKKSLCEKCYSEEIKKNPKFKNNVIKESEYLNDYEKIKDNYNKSKECLLMWKTTTKLIKEWLLNIVNRFNNYLNSINNFCLLRFKINTFLRDENNFEKYKNNFNLYFNYNIANVEQIEKYIKKVNEQINKNYNKNDDIYTMSKFFLDIYESYQKKDLKIETKSNIEKEVNINNSITNTFTDYKGKNKIENMAMKNYELKSEVKSFITFNNNNYFILGYKTGEIELELYEKKNNVDKKETNEKIEDKNEVTLFQKLLIKEFQNEINNICEIDCDKIVASDIKNNVKVILFEDNLTKYSVVNDLKLLENSYKIYTMAYLPIFSYYKNRNYFCFGDENNILVYKSNKMPTELIPPKLNYNDTQEDFTIVQPSLSLDAQENESNVKKDHRKEALSFDMEKNIELKTSVNSILELNEKYMAAACFKEKKLRIYNTQEGIKEVFNYSLEISEGNCIMNTTRDRNRLFVGCKNGIAMINLNKLKKINKFHLGQKIECLGFYSPEIIVCITLKDNETFIKQYEFNNDFKNISNYSKSKINSSEKISTLKAIDDRIFFLDKTKFIHYYQQEI